MSDYLPDVYLSVRRQFPEVARALDDLARVTEGVGPLPAREQRLVKLGISIGALAEGAVRSNVREALDVGVTADEIRHTALLAITTRGFPGGGGRPEVDRRSARRVVRSLNSVWSWRRRWSARGRPTRWPRRE